MNERWQPDFEEARVFETGVSIKSGARPDPPEHLLVYGGTGWVTWCGGGGAIKGFVTISRRRCSKCVALARQDLAENCEPDESSDFDWYLGRTIKR
jgi:hypothetical protein